jgi:pimeloyl-ACP methyl ester carboxylesterase
MPSSYVLVNDLRVHYQVWNPGGMPSVLLLHGLASNARIWDLIAPFLEASGMACYAPDLRGHGLSDSPEGDYGFATYHHDLTGLIEVLDLERPLIVGHSWGAMLALDYAARLPFGPRSPVGIVLVDGGMFQLDQVPGATWEATRERLAPPKLAGTPLRDFMERINSHNPLWTPDEQSQAIILANFEIYEEAVAGGDGVEGASQTTIERIRPHLSFEHHMQIVRAMWEFQTYERFRRVRCPVLALPSRQESGVSGAVSEFTALKQDGLARIKQILPGLQVHWLEQTVHDSPLQRPDELAALIETFARS